MRDRELRSESSVAVRRDEWGEIQFGCDGNGPVISRTPEELGIPRVIPAEKPVTRLSVWPKDWRDYNALRPMQAHVKRRRGFGCKPLNVRPDWIDPREIRPRGRGLKKDAPATFAGGGLSARATERKNRMTSGATATGGGAAKAFPSKRYGMPAVSTVAMDEVPESMHRDAGIAGPLYAQILELAGRALKVDFETAGHASYVLTKLRKIAKKEGDVLLSSKSADGKTRYFWLEKQ